MTRQVLFVQGGGEGTHDGWDRRLVASLERELGPGYAVRYPRMPKEADPKYAACASASPAARPVLFARAGPRSDRNSKAFPSRTLRSHRVCHGMS